MIDFTILENAIKDVIKENGNQEITGEILQNALLAMLTSIKEQTNQELTQIDTDKISNVNAGKVDNFASANGFYSENKEQYFYILDSEPAAVGDAYNTQANVGDIDLAFLKRDMPNMIIALNDLRQLYEPGDEIPFSEFFDINDENSFYADAPRKRLLEYARNGSRIFVYDSATSFTVPISAAIINGGDEIDIRASDFSTIPGAGGTDYGWCLVLKFHLTTETVIYHYSEL